MKIPFALLLLLGSPVFAPGMARADSFAPSSVDAEIGSNGTLAPSESMTRIEAGYRGSFITSGGFGPFSQNDYLPQFSITASQTVFASRHFSFAPGLAWDFGQTQSTARGDSTDLTVHRLTVPLEGRVHFGSRGYLFLRAAPGAIVTRAEVDDPSAPAALTKTRWLFATDVSLGYAWVVAPWLRTTHRVPHVWVQTDVGYGWASAEELALAPSGGGNGVDLGQLALRGVFFRIGAAASF